MPAVLTMVVPAHNEERFVGPTVRALRAAATAIGVPFEIIVVDDASTDATAAVAVEHGATVVSVRYRNISAVRNAGARQGRGDLLVFVDADTHVPARALGAAVAALQAGAVGGGAWARFDGRVPLYARALARSWRWLQRIARFASGCFLFCSRQAFDAAGGFDEALYAAEDVELSRRLKQLGRFVIVREVVVTSGRTMRSHKAADALRILIPFVLRGPRSFTVRQGPWYAPRRADPGSQQAHVAPSAAHQSATPPPGQNTPPPN